jgi:hypothetical protein
VYVYVYVYVYVCACVCVRVCVCVCVVCCSYPLPLVNADPNVLQDDYEKDQFFKRLAPLIEALPPEVARYKVLPELVKVTRMRDVCVCVCVCVCVGQGNSYA